MIDILLSKVTRKEVDVDVDMAFSTELSNHGSVFACGKHRVSFTMFDLINSIGTIQTRVSNPSMRMKFDRNSDLWLWLQNSSELKISISLNDPEAKKKISEDLGIGLAAVVTDKLFKVSPSTLAKINVTGKRPDFQCMTKLNKLMVVEGKGTFNRSTRTKQIKNAVTQKSSKAADIRVASGAWLNVNGISDVHYVDPPVISPDDPEYTKRLLMAHHYSQAFNYIGQKELSRYFYLMSKRIMHNKSFREFSEKEELFERIKNSYLRIALGDHVYFGRLDKLSNQEYIFSGFDGQLLWLSSFLDFREYEEEHNYELGTNFFTVSRDGMCQGVLKNLESLPDELRRTIADEISSGNIKHYQEYTQIEDIDAMGEHVFQSYLSYIFETFNFARTEEIHRRSDQRFDMFLKYGNKSIYIEIKKKNGYLPQNVILSLLNRDRDGKLILITNGKVKDKLKKVAVENNILIVDRPLLIEIIQNKSVLLRILNEI